MYSQPNENELQKTQTDSEEFWRTKTNTNSAVRLHHQLPSFTNGATWDKDTQERYRSKIHATFLQRLWINRFQTSRGVCTLRCLICGLGLTSLLNIVTQLYAHFLSDGEVNARYISLDVCTWVNVHELGQLSVSASVRIHFSCYTPTRAILYCLLLFSATHI